MENIENVPGPAENRTYGKQPLTMAVFLRTPKGVAQSYHRIYLHTYRRMLLIISKIEEFYYRNQHHGQNTKKLTLSMLATMTGIPLASLRRCVEIMVSAQSIMCLQDGKWKTLITHPMITCQQKAKHISRQYWGKKTPLYLFPYQKYVDSLKEEANQRKSM